MNNPTRLAPVLASSALALLSIDGQACNGPRLIESRIEIQAQASNLVATGSAGTTSSSKSLFGRRRSSSTGPLPASIFVGVLDVAGCDILIHRLDARISVQATNIVANPGGNVFVGGIRIR